MKKTQKNNKYISLLDKVGYVVIGDFQMDQHHLMLSVLLKISIQDHMWSQKKLCLEQNISIGSHCMYEFYITFATTGHMKHLSITCKLLHMWYN